MNWGWSDICIEIQQQFSVFIEHSYTGSIVVAMKTGTINRGM